MASNPFSKFAEEVLSGFRNKFHTKRSHKAITIPNNHGGSYLVPHARRAAGTPLWSSTNQTGASSDTGASTQSQDLLPGGVPGELMISVCDFMCYLQADINPQQSPSSDGGYQAMAAVYVSVDNGTCVVSASDTKKTEMTMLGMSSTTTRDSAADSSAGDTQVQLYFKSDDDSTYYLTYDPNPPTAEGEREELD